MKIETTTLLEMYRRMKRIRIFEEQVRELYKRGLMKGLAHEYIGEEAIAVGACINLQPDDYITSTHRGHGHLIAKGCRTDKMMAEILGKEDGYNHGKGGTMHIADCGLGILGANGIVGGGFGIATGAALSAKLQHDGRVTICFFGDGAANEGLLFECLNLASIWKLPIIFVCENNLYGQYTSYYKVTGGERLGLRATAFGIPEYSVDGQNVLAVYSVVQTCIEQAKGGLGPSFVEAKTYRYRGHHVGDPGTSYRSEEEIDAWKQRDPITLFREDLLKGGTFDEDTLHAVDQELYQEIEAAVDFAKGDAFPSANEVGEYVYA